MPAPCNPLADPACALTGTLHTAASSIASSILAGLSQAVTEGIRWTVVNTSAWWVQLPSPDLAAQPAVARIQQWLLPIAAAVAIGGLIAAGLRMAVTRRAAPLLDVGGGLVTIAAVTIAGTAAAALLVRAGDAWSSWVLNASTGGDFIAGMSRLLDLGGQAAPIAVLLFGLAAMLFALAQAVLMLFRQIALIILAGTLPLAAAGSIAPLTRTWIRKVTAWMLALICYKPAAAAVYATAFTLIGTSRSAASALTGLAVLILSVLLLPALMRFFTWTVGTVGSPGGGGGQFLSAAAMGAVTLGAFRSAGQGSASPAGPAQDQASFLSARLGPAGATAPVPGSAAPAGTGSPAAATTPMSSNGAAPPGPGMPAGAASAAGRAGGPAGAAAAAGPAAAGSAAASEAARIPGQAARRAAGAMGPEDQW